LTISSVYYTIVYTTSNFFNQSPRLCHKPGARMHGHEGARIKWR
jgi:hypothetical protein